MHDVFLPINRSLLRTLGIVLALVLCLPSAAQKQASFERTADQIQQRLLDSQAELEALRAEMAAAQLPLDAELRALEQQLKDALRERETLANKTANRALEERSLTTQIEARRKTTNYLSNLLGEYIRNFEASLHIAETQRYANELQTFKDAIERNAVDPEDEIAMVFARYDLVTTQLGLVGLSLTRLEDELGGTTYNGSAVDEGGQVENGTFIKLGPVAVFGSANGEDFGTAEQKLGTPQPAIFSYKNLEDTAALKALIDNGKGTLPMDATLGNAHVIESNEETLIEHMQAGGPVMYPILGLAAAVLLVGLYKWIAITLTPAPSKKRLRSLLTYVSDRDKDKAKAAAKKIRGPSGRMLQAGTEHLGEPRELIEEVMYEKVLTTRLKVQRLLPFIAICAAAAPLLGLLGTVSGIINTFNMMKVFDSSDMKNVSGGISEALITTKFGLIVAIPALLIHAFLSRKARGVIDHMEKSGVAFINQVLKTPPQEDGLPASKSAPSPDDTPPTDPEPEEDKSAQDDNQKDDTPESDPSDETQIIPVEEEEKELVTAEAGPSFNADRAKG